MKIILIEFDRRHDVFYYSLFQKISPESSTWCPGVLEKKISGENNLFRCYLMIFVPRVDLGIKHLINASCSYHA